MLRATCYRVLYVGWVTLAVAGLWLLLEPEPAVSDGTHASPPTNTVLPRVNDSNNNPMTVWACNRNDKCKDKQGDREIPKNTE